MELNAAIRTRRSMRGYKPDPVPKDILQKIVEVSQWAGSPGNMQPWEFAILGGKSIDEFKERLNKRTTENSPSGLPFTSPMEVPEFYAARRTKYYRENFDNYMFDPASGDIEEKKRAHYQRGGELYGAPNIIIVYTHKAFVSIPWGIMSIGIMAQNVCLAAMVYGLGTCIMGRPVDWPDILRDMLGVPEEKVFICGIIIGYPETGNKANSVPRIRMPLEEWVHWHV